MTVTKLTDDQLEKRRSRSVFVTHRLRLAPPAELTVTSCISNLRASKLVISWPMHCQCGEGRPRMCSMNHAVTVDLAGLPCGGLVATPPRIGRPARGVSGRGMIARGASGRGTGSTRLCGPRRLFLADIAHPRRARNAQSGNTMIA